MQGYVLTQDDVDFFARTALQYCAACRDYHYLRPYQLAGGWPLGPWRDAHVAVPLLRQMPQDGRVLIAGSGDAGLLAFVLEAAADLKPHVTIADQCLTPLLVCERLASQRGVPIETMRTDIGAALPEGPFDLVLAHKVLRFLPRAGQLSFLKLTREVLAPGGQLLVSEMRSGRLGSGRRGMRERVLAGLAANGIAIADPAFLSATLERASNAPRDPQRDIPDLAALLDEAGFAIAHDETVTLELPPGSDWGARGRRYIMARPA